MVDVLVKIIQNQFLFHPNEVFVQSFPVCYIHSSIAVIAIGSTSRSSLSPANQHPFPAKTKPILPNPFSWHPSCHQRRFIILFFNLLQCRFHRVEKSFFFSTLYFKFHNNGIIPTITAPLTFSLFPRFQHHVIPAKPAFPV